MNFKLRWRYVTLGIKVNCSYFPVVFDVYKYSRDEIYEKLMLCNIFARKYFYPLTNQFECYIGKFDAGGTPVAVYIGRGADSPSLC